jgi:hypothetical protein
MLTRPHTNRTVLPTLNQIAILDPDMFNDRVRRSVCLISTGPTVPVPAIRFVVHLDYTLASCRNDAPCVKHHAGDGVVIGVGIRNGASPEVPDLVTLLVCDLYETLN